MVTELELQEDGRYSFEGGWDGWISDIDAPHHIQFNSPNGGSTRFEIERDGAGSRLALIDRLPSDFLCPLTDESDELVIHQPGGPGTHWTGVAAGWHGFVDYLECHLGARPYESDDRAMCLQYDTYLSEH